MRGPADSPTNSRASSGAGFPVGQPAQPDANDLAALHACCFETRAWSAAEFAALMDKPGILFMTSHAGDGMIFAQFGAGEADLLTVAVHPDSRRAGIAADLLDAFLKVCPQNGIQEIFLEVGAFNSAALALYAKAGFSEAGRRKDYYQHAGGRREDALILRCAI